MTNFWTKIAYWFKPKTLKKKPQKPIAAKPQSSLNKPELTSNWPAKRTASFKRQRRLIGRLTAQAIAIQRHRIQERRRC